MDGVIVDSEPLHLAAFQAILKQRGHNISEAQYERYFVGKTDKAGFEGYFDSINETVDLPVIMDEKAKAYLALAGDQLVPYDGVIELITELAARKVPLALVTGSLRAEAEITLKTFSISQHFATIIAAEDITQSKPSPEGYNKGTTLLGVDPKDCIVIEDTPGGVQAAVAAGMRCLAVTTTHSPEALHMATVVVDQLRPGSLESL